MRTRIGRTAGLVLLLGGCVALGACRTEEQGRKLGFDKGHYGGKADTVRDAKVKTALTDRLKTQKENF